MKTYRKTSTVAGAVVLVLGGISTLKVLAQDSDPKSSSAPAQQQVDDPTSSSASSISDENATTAPELLAPTNTLEKPTPSRASSEKPVETQADDDQDAKAANDEAPEDDPDEATTDASTEVGKQPAAPPGPSEPSTQSAKDVRTTDEHSSEATIDDDADRSKSANRPSRSIVHPPRDNDHTGANRDRNTVERRAYRVEPAYEEPVSTETLPEPTAESRLHGRNVERPVFGIYLRSDVHDRAVIDEVVPRSPASAAGVRADDVILAFDGQRVQTPEDFYDIADHVSSSRSPMISISRTVDVRLRRLASNSSGAARQATYDQAPIESTRVRQSAEPPAPVRIIVRKPGYDSQNAPPQRREVRRRDEGPLRGLLFGR